MQCADLTDLLSAYADDQTSRAEARTVEQHLAACARCRTIVRRHLQTRRLLNVLDDNRWSPPDLRFRVRHAYRTGEAARPRRGARLGAVGALVLLLAVGLMGRVAFAPGSAPIAMPAPATAVVAQRSVPPPAPGSLRAAMATCWAAKERARARCLGIEPHMLNAVLAEVLLPSHLGTPLAPRKVVMKGGEARGPVNDGPAPQPV